MESVKSTRNNTVQIIRALAIIAVVMIHTTPLGYWQVLCRPFINFSVASFLFLSGYLTKIENGNWGPFYEKRILRVLIPYIFWTVLYTLSFQNIKELTSNLLTARAASPMYYIFVYIQFVLLTPLIGKLSTSRWQFLGWLIAPISVIVFKYYWLLTGQSLNFTVSVLWSDSCLGWFTYYYLGLILGNRIIEKTFPLKSLVLLYIFSLAIQMVEGYVWFILGDRNCGTQLKLSSFLTSTLFLLIVYMTLKSGRFEIKNKIFRMLGDYSFGIYLCHIMFIKFLISYVPIYRSIPYPITSAIIVLLSFFFCYFTDRALGSKISRWIGLR